MLELPIIIKMNIAHYEAMLKLKISDQKRSRIEEMLAEAKSALVLAARSERPHTPAARDPARRL